jgi:hypothetical protein
MNKLDAVLTEYQTLRDEILRKFHLHLQVYSIYTSALLIFYGLIVIHKIYDLIMVIPIFALAFLFRILWEQNLIRRISQYILTEIEEKKIPMLIGTINDDLQQGQDSNYANLWIGWQHFYREDAPSPKYYKYSMLMLFLLFSTVPAVIYNIYSIVSPLLKMPVVTILPIEILVFLLILNFTVGCYMAYKIIRM